jgi:hypothetical protein
MEKYRIRFLGFVISGILLCSTTLLFSQSDYDWWIEKHNWDGKYPWTTYLTMSPAYMGPNALPVPEFHGSEIPNQLELILGAEGHYSKGDQTANLYTSFILPLFTERASVQVDCRPIEIYRTDTITRDERASRQYDPEGYSFGDFYITTHIQILKDYKKWPDISLGLGIKTASGSKLDAARHTDTPGYWLEMGIGKRFFTSSTTLRSIDVYSRVGFYAYQTYMLNLRQNDAILYGAGVDLEIGKLRIGNQLTGYYGFLNIDDRPLVYRMILQSSVARKFSGYLMFQQGLNDYKFTSIRLAVVWNLSTKTSTVEDR